MFLLNYLFQADNQWISKQAMATRQQAQSHFPKKDKKAEILSPQFENWLGITLCKKREAFAFVFELRVEILAHCSLYGSPDGHTLIVQYK